jgi:MFS family permease
VPVRVKWLILLMTFSSLTAGYFWVATSAYLPQVGVPAGTVGLILAVNGVAFMVTAIPLDILADRWGQGSSFPWSPCGCFSASKFRIPTASPC